MYNNLSIQFCWPGATPSAITPIIDFKFTVFSLYVIVTSDLNSFTAVTNNVVGLACNPSANTILILMNNYY